MPKKSTEEKPLEEPLEAVEKDAVTTAAPAAEVETTSAPQEAQKVTLTKEQQERLRRKLQSKYH